MEGNSTSSRGTDIFGVIAGVLIALKLAGLIQCSWLFAVAPILAGIGIKLLLLWIVNLWIELTDWRKRRKWSW